MKLSSLIFSLLAFAVCIAQTAAANTNELTGRWRVIVEGQKKDRVWAVNSVTIEVGKGFILSSDFGWADGKLSGANSELAQDKDVLSVIIKTPAGSVIKAAQVDKNKFVGTFSTSSRVSGVTLVRETLMQSASELKDEYANEKSSSALIKETTDLRSGDNFHSMTPPSIPGGKTITTKQLKVLLETNQKITLIDTLNSKHLTIPSSIILPYSGSQERIAPDKFYENLSLIFDKHIREKSNPVVFFCLSYECWLSYNAALRAIKMGYTNVYWYRGGITSWKEAKLPLVASDITVWE